jgi:methionyl aminopeptidase
VGSKSWERLIAASRDALEAVIETLRSGILVRDIGGLVEGSIVSKGFYPISNLSGHSLQRYNLHAGLSVPNVRDDSPEALAEGTAVAIEPFATNGSGRVAGRKGGNIYRLIRRRSFGDTELESLVKQIDEEFKGLPFSERWVAKRVSKPDRRLKKLLRMGTVATYPILSDTKAGMVSQAEHTFIIEKGGCTVTTR